MIKCGVITTSRADYGIFRPLLAELQKAKDFEVFLYVSGSHLEKQHGYTITEIEQDGYAIEAHIPLGETIDSASNTAVRMSRCIEGYANAFEQCTPDILIALGDRYEMFAAVAASIPFNISVAHIHGGELTYGAQDDSFRHAITKMAHLHFSSTQEYANRIVQMGELPQCVFNVGALSVDSALATVYLSKAELCQKFAINWDAAPLLVTLHPETRSSLDPVQFAHILLSALSDIDRSIIFTHPNADHGGAAILKTIQAFQKTRRKIYLVPNFGSQGYFSMLKFSAAMIGNSSSGLTEAQAFELPVVNIGDRQAGRIRSACVIDTAADSEAISAAIKKALSPSFSRKIANTINPFGDGSAAKKIVAALRYFPDPKQLVTKKFHDI